MLHDNYTSLLRAQGKFYGWRGMEWLFGTGWSWYAIACGVALAPVVLAVCRALGFNPLLQVALVAFAGWGAARPIPGADGRRLHEFVVPAVDWAAFNARAFAVRVARPPKVTVVVRVWTPTETEEPQ